MTLPRRPHGGWRWPWTHVADRSRGDGVVDDPWALVDDDRTRDHGAW